MYKFSWLDHNWLALKINNDRVRDNVPNMRGTVYDLGCGTRPYEADILGFADRYIGVDWSHTLHELRADVIADLNEPLEIPDGVANTVVSFQVLEHLSAPQTMLSEAFRILQSGGLMFLSVPFQWWVHEAPWDYFRYTRHGLEHMLRKAGFVDIDVRAVTGFWAMWVLKLNYHTARYVVGWWPRRLLIRSLLTPIWFMGQKIAPLLDRLDPNEAETAGYFVTARKR